MLPALEQVPHLTGLTNVCESIDSDSVMSQSLPLHYMERPPVRARPVGYTLSVFDVGQYVVFLVALG